MLHRIHCARIVPIIVTLAAAAHGQGSGDESGDARSMADEGKKGNGSRSSDDKRKNDQKNQSGSGDRRGSDSRSTGPLAVPNRINEAFTYPTGNGCQYSATVRGSVKTARTSGGEEQRYTPSLTVNAWVTCQNNTELRVTDISVKESGMTRSQLEQAIELRASLMAESSGRRCVYVPDFSLGEGRLTGVGVAYLCPTGSAMGSGLADNQDGSGHDDDSVGSDNRPANDGRNHDRTNDNRNDRRNDRNDSRDNGRDRKGSSSDDNNQ
jgi:hypothetical protein